MNFLTDKIQFPNPNTATPEGVVAIGGDLSVERLLLAYKSGIFPWYDEGSPIIWWSPDPRMVLYPSELKISKSMRQVIAKQTFTVTYNTCFREVITQCANAKRKNQDGTWITNNMIKAYCKLNKLGYATSVEVWQDKELVGGLYGIDLGTIFCGESMFAKVSNASKVGLINFVQYLQKKNYVLIDCQVYTQHLQSLGAKEISREAFLSILHNTVR